MQRTVGIATGIALAGAPPLVLLAVLSACAASSLPRLDDYLPLRAEGPLTYAIEERNQFRQGEGEPRVAELRLSQIETFRPATPEEIERYAKGAPGLVAKIVRRIDREQGTEDEVTSFMSRGEEGILLHGSRDSSGLGEQYAPPLLVAPARLAAGARWEMGALRQRGMVLPTGGAVVGREDVTTAAGSFRDCLHLTYTVEGVTGTVGSGPGAVVLTGGSSTVDRWHAPGLGLVKETSETRLSGDAGGSGTLEVRATRKVELQATPAS